MSDPIDVEVDSGIDQITIDYDSDINQIIVTTDPNSGVGEISIGYDGAVDEIQVTPSQNIQQILVDIGSDVDQIDVTVNNEVDQINIEDVASAIQVVEVSTIFSSVSSVNSLTGDVVLSYIETLSYVSPVGGIYTYTISHNLGYENPLVMVYNTDNETVEAEHDAINVNTIAIKSLSNMNNFKVVVQR